MSLVPAFEIGVWNAWWFMVGYFLPYVVWMFTARGKAIAQKMEEESMHVKHETIIKGTFMVIMYGTPFYTVFLPFKLGTLWFYSGLGMFLIAEIWYIIILVIIHTTPLDKPFTTGPYRYSRHPMYLMHLLFFGSIAVACVSWVFLLVTVILGVLQYIVVSVEEQECLLKYGDVYREYMKRTPRWLGLPKAKH
jgi:isoprenylcysteine carboxyl methyltransferase (ICMT) family protein YpbQ